MAQRRRSGVQATAVSTGLAELRPDPDRATGWTLLLDGAPQSHVDLADPKHLEFEYVRRMASAVDLLASPGEPIRALHLGGGAMTLARYVALTRPGSPQRVVEIDAELVELVRRSLPWDHKAKLKVRVADAREAVAGMRRGGYDLIALDVFAGSRTPAHLASAEFVSQIARVLAPGGWLVANVADGPPLDYARARVATIRSVLPEVCVVADASVLRRRRFGNLVVLAARTALPIADLTRRTAGDWFPGRVETDLDRFTGGVAPVSDETATASPPPPGGTFSFPA